jgi:hypothetical protein
MLKLLASVARFVTWPFADTLTGPDSFWRDLDEAETEARKMRSARDTLAEHYAYANIGIIQTRGKPDLGESSLKLDMAAGVMTLNPGVSTRARKLLKRLRAGEFYPMYDKRTPKAMQELVEAGLAHTAGRPIVWQACYVPKGYIPAEHEIFPQDIAD